VERAIAASPLARIDYVQAVDAQTLEAPTAATRSVLLAVAVFFGQTRLIDNLEVRLRQS